MTTVAPQALLLLNDAFVRKQAEDLASIIFHMTDKTMPVRIEKAFSIIIQRKPTQTEMESSVEFLENMRDRNLTEDQALSQFCLAMLNLNEVIYVD